MKMTDENQIVHHNNKKKQQTADPGESGQLPQHSVKMSVILKCAPREIKAHLFFLIVALRPKTCMTDGGKQRKQRY